MPPSPPLNKGGTRTCSKSPSGGGFRGIETQLPARDTLGFTLKLSPIVQDYSQCPMPHAPCPIPNIFAPSRKRRLRAVLYCVCLLLITVEIVTEGIAMMTHELKRRTVYSAGIASLMLSVSFWIAPVALAKYTPPQNPSKPKETGTNTTRGGSCEANSSARLTALVPFSHVGETISRHPTFTWFVPDRTPRPLQLRLFTRTGQLLYRTEMQSQQGIMSVALPSNLPQLSIGQSYQWEVVLVCDPNLPSSNVVAA